MVLRLFMHDASPPVRAVIMMAEVLELEMEYEIVNLAKKQHFTPEFIEMNPAHCIPVLVDDSFIVNDSHAILPYLVNKYAQDDSLYPNEVHKRSLVDTMMHLDSGIFYPRLRKLAIHIYRGHKKFSKEDIQAVEDAYTILERYLEKHTFVAGENLTIADIAVVATISSLDSIFVPLDREKYPKIAGWLTVMERQPYYEKNKKGNKVYKDFIELNREAKVPPWNVPIF